MLDQFVDPAMVVDADCQLLSANDSAKAIIGASGPIRVGAGDVVHFSDARIASVFARVVAATCSPLHTFSTSQDLRVRGEGEIYAITCLPIAMEYAGVHSASLAALYAPHKVALVVVRRAIADEFGLTKEQLQQKFGLTRSETKLWLEFNGGGTLRAIAERLGVSRSTVQTHLKSIFAKTGVSRQRDLMVLLNIESRGNMF